MKFRISHSTVGDVSHIPHVLILATPVYYVCSGRSLENYGVVHKGKLIDYLEGQAIFTATRKSVRSRDQWWYSLVHFEIHFFLPSQGSNLGGCVCIDHAERQCHSPFHRPTSVD
jgi:hypothetical protein